MVGQKGQNETLIKKSQAIFQFTSKNNSSPYMCQMKHRSIVSVLPTGIEAQYLTDAISYIREKATAQIRNYVTSNSMFSIFILLASICIPRGIHVHKFAFSPHYSSVKSSPFTRNFSKRPCSTFALGLWTGPRPIWIHRANLPCVWIQNRRSKHGLISRTH